MGEEMNQIYVITFLFLFVQVWLAPLGKYHARHDDYAWTLAHVSVAYLLGLQP